MFTLRVAIEIVWHARQRYMPAVLAVGFSALLISLQVGIFLALMSRVTVPIDLSPADVWVMYPQTLASDLARPISTDWRDVLLSTRGVDAVDELIQVTNSWTTKSAMNDQIVLLGVNTDEGSLGPVSKLTPHQLRLLSEPGSVVVDAGDRERLEIESLGDFGQVNGRSVRVVGFVPGMTTLTGSCIVCSLETARDLMGMSPDETTFLLIACRDDVASTVANRVGQYQGIAARSASDFSRQSKMHWISKTQAGTAVAFVAFLGLLVGAAVTSQTLYAATASLTREFAVLQAMGIPRFKIHALVLAQAFVVAMGGLLGGTLASFGLRQVLLKVGADASLPYWLWLITVALTLGMAILSGLIALRSLRHVEPMNLLR